MPQSIRSSHCADGLSVFSAILIKNHQTFADSYMTFNREMPYTRYLEVKQTECNV